MPSRAIIRRFGAALLLMVVSLLFFFFVPDGFSSFAVRVRVSDRHSPPKMDQSRSKCRQEWSGVDEIIKGCLIEDMFDDLIDTNLNARLQAKDHMLKVVKCLPPQTKHAIFDRLMKHKVPIHVVREYGNPRSWCMERIEFLISPNAISRRSLADRTIQIMSSHFSSASPTVTASFQSMASSRLSTLPSSPSSSHPMDDHNHNHSKGAQDPKHPQKSDGNASGVASRNGTVVPSAHHKDGMNPMILAVILTGLVSFVLAACFFVIYDKFCRRRNLSDSFHKDERPLLTLSLSDFSDSSRKSYGPGSSSYNDRIGKLSFKTESSPNGRVAPLDVNENEIPPAAISPGVSETTDATPSSSQGQPKPAAPLPPPPAVPPVPPVKKAPPPGPPPPPLKSRGPRSPPPPKGVAPPRPPGPGLRKSPLGHNRSESASSGEDSASKTKLKPFFWDKVCANPDQSMVWHQISSGSFQFNEEMIESLFGCNTTDKQRGNAKKASSSIGGAVQQVQILDHKKSQNLAILLRALNVTTEEVCEALMEGNELPTELLQTLLKMAPTPEEELRLRLYNGDISQIGIAERFLKALVDIPFAFKRLDALLYMGSLQEELSNIEESFTTLETACNELRSSRLFLKLLEAVLKTGNRMNDGTFRGGAQAFKLDTLLKLSDVKGTDGKTTLLHFVVQEIIRSEGMKAARIARESGSFSGFSLDLDSLVIDNSPVDSGDQVRVLGLKVVSGLGDELENVKKAAALDADTLTGMVAVLGRGLVKTKEFLDKDMKSAEEDSEFHRSLECFVEHAEKDITVLLEEEKRTRLLVKSTTDYFHGNAAKDEGLRLFIIVRDFLGMIEKVCNEVRQAPPKRSQKPAQNKEGHTVQPPPDPRRLLFPAVRERRADTSDSDDDST